MRKLQCVLRELYYHTGTGVNWGGRGKEVWWGFTLALLTQENGALPRLPNNNLILWITSYGKLEIRGVGRGLNNTNFWAGHILE